MGLIGEVWADASLHIDKDSFSDYASRLKNSEDQVSVFSEGPKAAMVVAFTLPATVVTCVATYGTNITALYEKTQLRLDGLLGNQEKAGKVMEWSSDFAATTPFEFPELADVSAKLLSAGMDAKEREKLE